MVFPGPVKHRINNILTGHCTLRCYIIAAAGPVSHSAVTVCTEEITGYSKAERMHISVVHMVVHHVHDHADPGLLESIDHFFHLNDASARIKRVTGIRTFRNIIIDRIIAPVILAAKPAMLPGFIYAPKIIHREYLDIADTLGFQVIKSCRASIRGPRTGFCSAQECAAQGWGHA